MLTGICIATMGYVVWLSLHDVSLLRSGPSSFVGLSNFVRLFSDARGYAALGRTALFTCLATAIEVGLGLSIAVLMDRDFKGKRIVRALLLIPMIMTPVVTGLTWRFLFNAQSGMINYGLSLLGWTAPVDWLGSPNIALYSVMAADVWQWTPFVILLAMAALENVSSEVTEAANIDGANGLQTFWYVVLPILRPALVVAGLIRAIDSAKAFDLFYIMTKGGPALSTETENLYGYSVAFTNFDISYSITIALILTVVTNLALLALYGALASKKVG